MKEKSMTPGTPLEIKQALIIESLSKFMLLFDHGFKTMKAELQDIAEGRKPGEIAKSKIEIPGVN
ncbi:hypothetical protein C5B42_04450 [Candidatus Cerribacteria bacterium 'Amazon FNV 2010 28 9']|uniref:Uncharacterized protein n=1 Tax=Candidatus Cerribacteria bacterium 'Amazon FNV 2010 28 9' TaxID=2081795 RepID=A0A317JS45_9BACT|nr:MAG: hypothetical protein C5B42_04450 [Candidatus Cerribacteria bacterium 'Amazon FNV 2010 28 9']